MAKLKATEAAKLATLEGVQMMGGCGYAVEYDTEAQLRTAIATTIFGGTSEIQRSRSSPGPTVSRSPSQPSPRPHG